MFDITRDIDSLTHFKRNTTDILEQLKATGQPLVLTVNGKAELVVQDAAAYQRLLESVDQAEAVAGIRAGLEDVKLGRTRPLDEAVQDFRRKYEPSS